MKGKIIIILVFLGMLLLPSIVMLTPLENKYKNSENRKLVNINIHSLSDFKNFVINFKGFYTDNFGLRFILYSFYKENISKKFNESPSTNNVIYGKNEWLFLGDSDNNAFSKAKGNIIFNNAELHIIKENINKAKKWCKEHNIQFYIAIIPGKHTAYKEYLPYSFPKQKTKIDQLADLNLDIIDLRDEIQNAKTEEFLYFKTDTHWNQLGAFVGYKKIMAQIQIQNKEIKILTKKDISNIEYEKKQGDLNKMLGIDIEEIRPVVVFKNNKVIKLKSTLIVPYYHGLDPTNYENRYYNTEALNCEKVIVLRDSFSTALKEYLSATFQDVLLVYNHYFEKELIVKEKPDFLVYEIAERFADRLLTIHEK